MYYLLCPQEGGDIKKKWQGHRNEVKSLTNLSANIYHLHLVDDDSQELTFTLGPGDTVYMRGDVLKLLYHWVSIRAAVYWMAGEGSDWMGLLL